MAVLVTVYTRGDNWQFNLKEKKKKKENFHRSVDLHVFEENLI